MKGISKQKEIFSVPVSGYDRFCMVAEKRFPPFCIQSILEGDGDISIKDLEAAVKKASDANPGSRLILKNNKFVDSGIYPPVKELEISNWDDKTISQNDILNKPIDSCADPTFEIFLVKGNAQKNQPTRLIFRSAHTISDGHGNKFFMEEVFRALRGEKLLGTNTNISLDSLMSELSNKSKRHNTREPLSFSCKSPTGNCEEHSRDFITKRIKVNTTGKEMTARLASILAKESFNSNSKKVCFMLPIDLRGQRPDIRSLTNFASSMTLEVTKDQSVDDIQKKIFKNIVENPHGNVGKIDNILKYLPKNFLKSFFTRSLDWQLNNNRFLFSGFISDVGEAKLDNLKCPNFNPKQIYNVGVSVPIAPLSIVTVKNPDHVELTMSMPKALATNGRMDKLLENIKSELELYGKNQKEEIFEIKDPITETGQGIISDDFKNKTIVQLFQEQVSKNPNAIAVVSDKKTYTYKQLDERSNQLANSLIKMGAGPDKIIPIIVDRSADTIVGILGILKSQSAYLPIDPKAPLERRNTILEDVKADIVLTQKGKFNEDTKNLKLLFLEDEKIYSENKNSPLNATKPNNLAYVIFTSGTTGKPKGIGVEHSSVVNHLLWAKKDFLDPKEKHYTFPFFSTMAFDFTVLSTFLPLVTGNSMKVFEKDMAIAEIANDPSINIIKATPTHLKIMREFINDNTNIKKIISGGESFTSELAQSIYKKLNGKVDIYNEYGPTEATVACICHKFDPKKDIEGQVPIGYPIDNTKIYILDKDLKPVSFGQSGEIFIAGDCLARGYLNLPEANAKYYLDDPFKPGSRMYRSGDIAKWIGPNKLLYEARADHQVKIRGYRIETADIESAISTFEGIKNSAVVPRKIGDRDILVAYIVADHTVDTSKLRDHLSTKVNHYMIPASFCQIEALPTTINGKLDTRNLPNPTEVIDIEPEHAKLTKTSDVRGMLVETWSELLKLNNPMLIKNDTSFTELGGDSLSMITLLTRISDRLPESKQDLFQNNRLAILEAKTFSDMTKIVENIMNQKTKVNNAKKHRSLFSCCKNPKMIDDVVSDYGPSISPELTKNVESKNAKKHRSLFSCCKSPKMIDDVVSDYGPSTSQEHTNKVESKNSKILYNLKNRKPNPENTRIM